MNSAGQQHRVPGPLSEKLFQEESQFMAPGLQSIALFSQIVVDRAQGVRITDIDGNTFIDFTAGIGVGSVGHCHPHYVKIMEEQLRSVTFASYSTKNRIEFLKKLASLLPGELNSIQMYSGGAEAVEAALRLAKSVTGKYEFVGFWGAFHGKTRGVMGLLGDTSFKANLGPIMPGLYLAGPYAYCYRCRWKTEYPGCGFACVEWFREAIRYQTTHSIAGILVEPVQGTAGNVVPPKGFIKAIQEVAKEFDALLIADEMITGFGRTGLMWGVDHDGIVPDVMTLGKGIGGGFPMSAIAATREHAAAKPFGNPSGSSSSYGGNPLASAAGKAVLDILEQDNLVQNSRVVGEAMLNRLKEMKEKHRIIGDVRGKGLMIGVELVSDTKSKTPLDKKLTRQLFHECLDRGLISMCYSPCIRINPPLVITESEAMEALSILDEALTVIEAQI